MPRVLSLLLAVVLTATACGGEDAPGAATPAEAPTSVAASVPATSTTVSITSVEVERNIIYRSGAPDPRSLDVYYSAEPRGGPTVVLFHGNGVTKSNPLYTSVARAAAEQGAVVFAPEWPVMAFGRPEELSATYDGTGCAVAYALAHAGDYGGDPERLVLVGHSAGATPASMLGVLEVAPVADCSVAMAPFRSRGMVLWDGDLMNGGSGWDAHGDRLPGLMEVSTLWPWLGDAPRTPTLLVTGALARAVYRRCGVADPANPFWVRDPDGWFYQHLEARGALEDDCVDIGDVADLLADTMKEHGFDATHLILEDSNHMDLSDEDQALLVSEIVAIAGG